jgi:hypothetical protein
VQSRSTWVVARRPDECCALAVSIWVARRRNGAKAEEELPMVIVAGHVTVEPQM